MGRYFGTDGFRGEANNNLTADHAYKIGRFLGWYYGEIKRQNGDDTPARIVIGKDTRRSSYMFEYTLVGGLVASGADAYLLHVTTTPSVAYVARTDEFDCGIMISASHNPYYDNGIKLINGNGEKMDEGTIALVEDYLDGKLEVFGEKYEEIPFAHTSKIGRTVDYVSGRNRYIGYLITLATRSYRGMRVGLDCSNGSAWMIAKSVFDALGAKTYVINNTPDGTNINTNCGSTHIESLQERVLAEGADCGIANDGDADRCLFVDERGQVLDGDHLMLINSLRMKKEGRLNHDMVVGTVMSNLGFGKALKEHGINTVSTKVGDRYVLEEMRKNGYSIGGEQSGHIIFLDENTTGDGLLSALHLLQVMVETGKPLSELAQIMEVLPQALVNAKVANHKKEKYMEYPEIADAIQKLEEKFAGEGRVLIRPSGTEPLVRVMIEGKDQQVIQEEAQRLASLIQDIMF